MLCADLCRTGTSQNKKLSSDAALGALRCDRLQCPDQTVTEGARRYHKADPPTACQTHCLRFILHIPCDILSGGCFFTGPWTVTRSSLRMLRRVAAFCRPLRPVLLLVLFPCSRSPVVGVPGLC